MRILMPIVEDSGLQSRLAEHFGRTPYFSILEVDEKGFVKVDRNMMTNKPGVYAIGDLTGGVLQTVVACGDGATAAVNAYLFIKGGWYGKGDLKQA